MTVATWTRLRALWGARHGLQLCLMVAALLIVAPVRAADSSPPEIELLASVAETTVESGVWLRGVATDSESGVVSVEIDSDALGVSFAAELDSGGNFQLEVPLEVGSNRLDVSAINGDGIRSEVVSVTVTRSMVAAPSLTLESSVVPGDTLEATTTLQGQVWTTLALEEFSIRLGALRAIPERSAQGFGYRFDDVPLIVGENRLEVTVYSPHGSVRASVVIHRLDPSQWPDDVALVPEISLDVPSESIVTASASFRLAGWVRTPCLASLTVNELAPDQRLDAGDGTTSFYADISLPTAVETSVEVVAESCDGQRSSRVIQIRQDDTAPAIVFVEPGPQAGTRVVVDNPLRIRGYVDEPELAGVLLAGQPLELQPALEPGRWEFEAVVKLSRGVDTELELVAWNRAGAKTSDSMIVRLENDVEISLLAPRDDESMVLQSGPNEVQVAFQVIGAGANDGVWVQLDSEQAPLLGTGEGPYGAALSVTVDGTSTHTWSAIVRDDQGATLARASADFTVADEATVPIALTRVEPARGAREVEANQSLRLFFNRAIEPSLVEVQVRESFSGDVYETARVDTDLRNQSRVEKVQVSRSRTPVAGRTQNLPGNRAFSFHPQNAWTYGASIEAIVFVDGQQVAQTQFRVREFPTLYHGFVLDEYLEPLANVDVELVLDGHSVTTDANGMFSFGWGWSADQALKPGLHRVAFNAKGTRPDLGYLEGWLTISKGEVNTGQSFVVHSIPENARFTPLRSGQRFVMDEGRLVLDLESATIEYGPGNPDASVAPQIRARAGLWRQLLCDRSRLGQVHGRGSAGPESRSDGAVSTL